MSSPLLAKQPDRPFDTEALRRAVREAAARVSTDGCPATVRLHVPLGAVDPWQLLGHPDLAGRKVFAWYDDAEDRTFLAVEVVHYLRLHGRDRFSAASARDAELRAHTVDVGAGSSADIDAGAPLLCAGFAFATDERSRTDDPTAPPWENWDHGTLWVPRAVLHRIGTRSVLVVAVGVTSDSVVDEAVATLVRRAERVLGSIGAPHPARPSTPALGGPTSGRSEADKRCWESRVDAARSRMAAGGLDKVVLARAESWTAPDGFAFDPFATAAALRARQSRCTTFVFCRRDGTAFVGATPETLVRKRGTTVSTVSLAGTLRRDPDQSDATLAERLLDSRKDRHEQQLVTHAIRSALSPVCATLHVDDTPTIVRLADVLHLETQLRGALTRDRSVFELLGRLHPTPAVGGLPAAEALSWLRQEEGLDRGWYAAPVGWVSACGDGHFAVAIRSVLLAGSHAWTFAGCGIVPDSDPASEWRETLSKLQAVSHGLAVVPEAE